MKQVTTTKAGAPAVLDTDTGEISPLTNTHAGAIAPFFKTPYNHDTDAECQRTALICTDPSKTQQNFRDEQDINKIVARVLKTGVLPEIALPGQYADLTTQEDYHTMLNRIAETNGLFYKLDPELRAEYNNDPGAWLQDVNQKLNAGELEPLRQMGLDMKSVDTQIETLKAQAAEQEEKEAAARYAEKAAKEAAKAPKT